MPKAGFYTYFIIIGDNYSGGSMNKLKVLCTAMLILLVALTSACGMGAQNDNGNETGNEDNGGDETPKVEFASGSGTESDPYVIQEGYQWCNINKYPDAAYILGDNINLEGITSTAVIGTVTHPFTGTLDGKGYYVHKGVLQQEGKAGLFGVISGGTVKNLTFKDSKITLKDSDDNDALGSFVGQLKSGGAIENCHTKNVTCYYDADNWNSRYIGGFAGIVASASNMIYCSAQIVIESNTNKTTSYYPNYTLGGLLGKMEGGTVDACYASGTIDTAKGAGASGYTSKRIGGIVGNLSGGTVSNVYSSCTFTANIKGQTGALAYYSLSGSYISFGLSFCEFPTAVTALYCEQTVTVSDAVSKYYSPAQIEQSNNLKDNDSNWKNNPYWKKGTIHPELVSYEEYLELKAEAE